MGGAPMMYPIHLGLAYLFLVGYLVRTIFVNARLPGAVGVILTGFAFSYFIQDDIFLGRDHLQGLAFFLVLLTAGFEISVADLKPYIMVFAILPATLEMMGIAAYAYFVLQFSKTEACVLGTVLFCIGDGLVIPKMGEFGVTFPGHPMPRLVFTWAPIEASYALTLFGVLQGLSEPVHQKSTNLVLLILGNFLRIVATIFIGAIVGSASGWMITHRTEATLRGKQLFTGATVEAFLMILAVALAGFGFGAAEGGVTLVPLVFSPGSLFQPELLVIIIGCCFAAAADADVLHNVETTMGGVWVFGQLILFSMLGSKTDPGVFTHFVEVVPMLAVGVVMRFIGVMLVTYSTLRCRQCNCDACYRANLSSAFSDGIFCFLSTLPRATIQGALGSVPVSQNFFQFDPGRARIQTFIATAARLYIVLMSIGGSLLLDAIGPTMLKWSQDREHTHCEKVKETEEQYAEHGWKAQDRRRSTRYVPLLEDSEDGRRIPNCLTACCSRRSSHVSGVGALDIGALFGPRRPEEDYHGVPTAPNLRHAAAVLGQHYQLDESDVMFALKNHSLASSTDEESSRVGPQMSAQKSRKSMKGSIARPRMTKRRSTAGVRHTTIHLFESAMPVLEEAEEVE